MFYKSGVKSWALRIGGNGQDRDSTATKRTGDCQARSSVAIRYKHFERFDTTRCVQTGGRLMKPRADVNCPT